MLLKNKLGKREPLSSPKRSNHRTSSRGGRKSDICETDTNSIQSFVTLRYTSD
jgi:hypothetical protein